MRILKFRFWKEKRLQGILELKKNDILDMPWDWDAVDQFTGLFDKSGKEIYEGDILKHSGENGVSLISWQEKSMAFVFCKDGWLCNHFIEEMSPIEEYEVIGNLHENPELISK